MSRDVAIISLKDFYILDMMYGVDWNEMHRFIFQHKKKNAYVLLYSGDLPCDAQNALKKDFETTISKLVDSKYHSFSENSDVNILTIKGTKTSGRHLSCDFVDVHHAKSFLSCYKMSHGTGGNSVGVEPSPDEV